MATDSAYAWDVFIAHAGPDKATAEQLYDLLGQDCRVFLDSRCLELGDDWDDKLAAAQGESFLTAVLISANTAKAYYQREEIAAAISLAREEEGKHRVVPVCLNQQDPLSNNKDPLRTTPKAWTRGLRNSLLGTMCSAAARNPQAPRHRRGRFDCRAQQARPARHTSPTSSQLDLAGAPQPLPVQVGGVRL